MAVHIIAEGAALELHAAMKYSIAGIVIMTRRTVLTLKGTTDMIFLASKYNRLYVHSVAQSKRSNKSVLAVVYAWGNSSVIRASCLMMIRQRNSIIAMAVVFAE